MREERYSVIGKPVPRVDGIIKTKGEAMYTTDLSLPGMLYGKILRSPYPHAKIIRIDTSKAEKVRGVKAVITGKDAPNIKYGCLMFDYPEAADQYLLARDKVCYIGDAVGAVAALDEDIATEALDRIVVEYEELPSVFSIEEATKPDAILIHEGSPGNISMMVASDFGDVEKGFLEADYIREDRFITQLVQHCCLEPQVCLANFESTGKLTLWSSTQAVFLQRMLLARVLGMPDGMVRVIKPHMGGGFGEKAELFPLHLCTALLSKKSGRPVKICHTREEEFAASSSRHPMMIELKIGVKKDGAITSRLARVVLDGGAYNSLGPLAAYHSVMWLSLPYKQPNIKFESIRVYTNRSSSGALRGFTAPQIHFATEVQMDMVAEELGMDPLDLRIKNGLKAGDVTASGLRMTSGGLEACIQRVAEKSEWRKRYKKLPPLRGIGIGCDAFCSGSRVSIFGPSTALATILIKANIDGTVTVNTGAADVGQGSDTVVCQIAAEELGIRVEDIRIMTPDTDLSPPDYYTASSRV
ncbi:MAG: molybdopterin cofactor-binding domain-containing protein, partial [Nitrospirota bacterium]